ncbi:cytidylyltransferase family-domain-containing protein [Blastocladiella britannica]|nr:cytidylyltransferase family-domain-containing protein [Blastocladiella britannica]
MSDHHHQPDLAADDNDDNLDTSSSATTATATAAGLRARQPVIDRLRAHDPVSGGRGAASQRKLAAAAAAAGTSEDSDTTGWPASDTARSGGDDADADAEGDDRTGGAQGGDSPPVQLLADAPTSQRWRNWWVRTTWTLIMIAAFFVILLSGHGWAGMLVVLLQLAVFREVIAIAHVPSKERKLPWFRLINWYFLFATNYFLYGESVLQHFAHLIPPFLLPFASHHRFISFLLYCVGLVFFVLNLKKGFYKFQFAQFAWTHMALLLVVVQSHAIINNIFEGMIWFVVPCSLVIANDVFAYICGFFWGKTPLIKLSPKKTWEGFIGGALMTLLFGFFSAWALIQFPYFICPVQDQLGMSFWSDVQCTPNPVFLPKTYVLPVNFPLLGSQSIRLPPFLLHTLVLSLFASSIAPFGGFFASGVKRAFKIKDFGDTIPGHGGITDRFDCQFMMGTFSFIYVTTFVGRIGAADVLQRAMVLSTSEQMMVFRGVAEMLRDSGALEGAAADACIAAVSGIF